MNKLAAAAAVAYSVAMFFAACSTLPPPPPPTPVSAACQSEPQWIVTDAKGAPTKGVFVCFGEQGHLLYTTRALTLEQLAKLTMPAAASKDPVGPMAATAGAARKARP